MVISNWNESETLTDRKSKFQARACVIKNQDDIPDILNELLFQNKSVSKASHPHMYAWRTAEILKPNSSTSTITKNKWGKSNSKSLSPIVPTLKNIQQGSLDCGESGAGQRLLTLLERSAIVNVLVIVTRWYGGTPLGSRRFRHISATAVESLKKAKFLL